MDATAQAHADRMASRDILMHRQSLSPYGGEVIASGTDNPQTALQLWFDSPDHNELILSPWYDKAGLGYADGYWVLILN